MARKASALRTELERAGITRRDHGKALGEEGSKDHRPGGMGPDPCQGYHTDG